MKDELKLEDLEIGQELKEKQKFLNQREQFYRESGFYKVKGEYTFYKDVKHVVTKKTNSSIEVMCGKKTNKGVDALSWFDMRSFNERFEK